MSVLINHVAVSVFDLQRSTEFYQNILQLQSIPEPFKIGMHSWFQIAPNCQLHLIKSSKKSTEHHFNNHISFCVADIDSFVRRLVENNIEYRDAEGNRSTIQTRPDGIKQIFFQDPDGYWLEVNNDFPQKNNS